MLENPGEQRGRCGFAVRAGDDDGAFAADEKFPEQFRQRAITQLVIEHEFGLRVAAGNRVANDGEVGLVRKVPLRVTVHHRDLPLREERGHRRINILVRAGDGKAPVLHGGGSRGHGGATDAGKMNRFDFRRKHSGEINHEDAQAQSFLVPNGFAVRGRKIL